MRFLYISGVRFRKSARNLLNMFKTFGNPRASNCVLRFHVVLGGSMRFNAFLSGLVRFFSAFSCGKKYAYNRTPERNTSQKCAASLRLVSTL